MAKDNTVVNSLSEDQPVFAHWFGIQMYNAYESAKMQIATNSYPIKIELDNEIYEIGFESLQNVMAATREAAELHQDRKTYIGSRGLLGCAELRSAEATFTCLYARAIDRFVFPNEATGACLHQVPCRKRTNSGSPEMADVYIIPFKKFRPGNPVVLSDLKVDEQFGADRESMLYSAVGVEEGTCKHHFPVLIGIPSTTAITELQLHVNVHEKVWKLVIARSHPSDGALLCTLRAGVQHLINTSCLTQRTPLKSLAPFKQMDSYSTLGPRKLAFFNKETKTVFKFFDRGIKRDECLNLCAMRELVSDIVPLPDIKLKPESDESRLYTLSYTYIEESDRPIKLGSFIGVIKILSEMHERNLVHGDVRRANMVFDRESYLIDFDFVGKNGIDVYPFDYNSRLPERHMEAVTGRVMMFMHDRYSLKVTIEQNVRGLAKEAPILKQLLDPSLSLRELVTHLESASN